MDIQFIIGRKVLLIRPKQSPILVKKERKMGKETEQESKCEQSPDTIFSIYNTEDYTFNSRSRRQYSFCQEKLVLKYIL